MATRRERFEGPILECFVKRGGRANVVDVLADLKASWSGILTDWDYELVGGVRPEWRWRHDARCVFYWDLPKDGLLRKSSPRGMWEITEKGRQARC